MDNIFLLTLFFIFFTTFASTYLARLVRDRCLKDFQNFHVTLELKDKPTYWGQLQVFSSGLEVRYAHPVHDKTGHVESSILFLKDRMGNMQALYRFHDELSADEQRRRAEEIERSYHPGLHHQLWRALRNFFNTFRDAIGESIGFVVSRFKETGGSQVVQTQDARITKIGQTVLDTTARQSFEPILELYIGRRVVAQELRTDKSIREHGGILKDYTADWLELLDCRFHQEFNFHLSHPEQLRLNKQIDFMIERQPGDAQELTITVENHGNVAVTVVRLTGEGVEVQVNAPVAPGQQHTIHTGPLPAALWEGIAISDIPTRLELRGGANGNHEALPAATRLPALTVVIAAERTGDLCLPRAHAYVAHGSEPIGEGWFWESWREFRQWSSQHPVVATLRLLWALLNGLLVGYCVWSLIRLIWGLEVGILFVSLLAGINAVAGWMIQWSARIRANDQFAQKLRNRLLLLTLLAALLAALFVYLALR